MRTQIANAPRNRTITIPARTRFLRSFSIGVPSLKYGRRECIRPAFIRSAWMTRQLKIGRRKDFPSPNLLRRRYCVPLAVDAALGAAVLALAFGGALRCFIGPV